HPDLFAQYQEEGMRRGFRYVESGPLVRSSYHAERHIF
ncbi:MAG: lipoyl synthase, partial [Bacteroidota bacterium]